MTKIITITNDDDYVYEIDEATKVVYKNISKKLQNKFDYDDIYLILELKNKYMDIVCSKKFKKGEVVTGLEDEEIQNYIINHAIENDLFITANELTEIDDAEFIYYNSFASFRSALKEGDDILKRSLQKLQRKGY